MLYNSVPSIIDDNLVEKVKVDYNLYREWVKSDEARRCLHEILNQSPSNSISALDCEDYIVKRGLQTEIPYAISMLSSMMTFPLTLAYMMRQIFPNKQDKLSILITGARSESSLPGHFWKEMLFAYDNISNYQIGFSGPDLQANGPGGKGGKPARVSWTKDKDSSIVADLFHVPQGKSKLHENVSLIEQLNSIDLLVLFNPGFGSKVLQESWKPTLNLLLKSGKPIICTAHSKFDANRDLNALNDLISKKEEFGNSKSTSFEFLIEPKLNPFASRCPTVDDKEETEARIVTANQYCYAVRGK